MKNLKILILLPAFLLSSCGENYGKEITPEEATTKLNAITSKNINTNTMNLVAKEYTEAYDASKKQKAVLDADIIIASGRVKKFRSKISSNGSSLTTEASWFIDSRYGGEVFFISASDGKNSQKMAVRKNNPQFATLNSKCEELASQLKEVIKNMQDPLATLSRKDIVSGSISGFLFNYYAKGEDDLTIKSTPQSSEVTGYFNATYNDGLIRKYDYKFTMKDGTYVKEKYDLNFNGNVKVEMPSGYNNIAIL